MTGPDLTFDLLVIGGGINGSAIARDAALRGLSVCIVEGRDWGAGTTSKSSKLAHGGLRYLEQFELGLVHEALRDRERLLAQAPHLVRPLRFVYPIYPEVAARRTVRVGLMLYDLLSWGKSLPRRRYLGRAATQALVPGIEAKGLTGAATFHDGQVQHVERLVLESIAQAQAHGATALNHARVESILVERDEAGGRRATGALVAGEDGASRILKAHAIVNATGCWVDEVLGPLAEGKPAKVRKTKGIHLVVPGFTEVAVMVRNRDGRSFFILPWQGDSIIGTTDTDYEGDPFVATADPEDVAYLKDAARRYFPDAPIDEVRYTYAGVRALVNEAGVTESNVTRRHILYDHATKDGVARLWSLQGGKITTARSLAEACVDKVARALGRPGLARTHPTRTQPFPGAATPWPAFRASAVAQACGMGLDEGSAAHIVDTYGARWLDVVRCDPREGALRRVHPDHPAVLAQATFGVRSEQATHLADVLLRRTTLGLAPDGNQEAAATVAAWMAPLLGWDAARQAEELRAYRVECAVLAVPGMPRLAAR
ncbi:MAG TPA: glycerol-3-phosphate dehydrogenase/oxidase [Candidatus Thermoplasmatota archaeon]|nr:glycerol-3-phosphate dehydrogenase/oxidase [Candidatus Thermoplasmatota archaeon]